MEVKEYDAKVLAYIGDAVYELYVREHITINSYSQVNVLHKKSTKYVSAKAQAHIVELLSDFLSDGEKDIIRRGRNAEVNTLPKNTELATYKIATGFEALIGYLYISKQTERLKEIINKSIEIVEIRK